MMDDVYSTTLKYVCVCVHVSDQACGHICSDSQPHLRYHLLHVLLLLCFI